MLVKGAAYQSQQKALAHTVKLKPFPWQRTCSTWCSFLPPEVSDKFSSPERFILSTLFHITVHEKLDLKAWSGSPLGCSKGFTLREPLLKFYYAFIPFACNSVHIHSLSAVLLWHFKLWYMTNPHDVQPCLKKRGGLLSGCSIIRPSIRPPSLEPVHTLVISKPTGIMTFVSLWPTSVLHTHTRDSAQATAV